jgi:hypothetical protein
VYNTSSLHFRRWSGANNEAAAIRYEAAAIRYSLCSEATGIRSELP